MARYLLATMAALALGGCAKNVSTSSRDTGGGGITWYENHSARKAGASGTGSWGSNVGQGPVLGSGATDVPGNDESPTESNGGQGLKANPNALI